MSRPISGRSPSPNHLRKPLHVGKHGPLVRALEGQLKKLGLLQGKVDGFYDAKTKAAVQRFEHARHWKTDGVVGDRLWRRVMGMVDDGPEVAFPNADRNQLAFQTVNINIQSNPLMSQKHVVDDVKRAYHQGDLIGWNEIAPARYVKAIRDLGRGWGHYFPKDGHERVPNPISWDKSVWSKQGAGFVKTHGGKAKVSPSRYITWVKLKHEKSQQTVVRLNTHLVSGAWSKGRTAPEWRREQWRKHIAKLHEVIAHFEKQGLAVIVGGDFNRDMGDDVNQGSKKKLLGDQVQYANRPDEATHGRRTIDYVMNTKADIFEDVRSRVHKGYASDHDAVVVRYTLNKKK